MDDDFSSLEAELQRLRPVAPPRELVARLAADLAPATRISRPSLAWWVWAGGLPAAAAAVAALVFVARRDAAPVANPIALTSPVVELTAPAASEEVFKPVAAENVLYAVHDEGLVTLADGTAARRERLNYVDTITWKNSRTNASVRWTVPREEIRVVPVKFQ